MTGDLLRYDDQIDSGSDDHDIWDDQKKDGKQRPKPFPGGRGVEVPTVVYSIIEAHVTFIN